MPNYLFLLHDNPAVFAKVSPEEMQAIIQRYTKWKKRMQRAAALRASTLGFAARPLRADICLRIASLTPVESAGTNFQFAFFNFQSAMLFMPRPFLLLNPLTQ